MIKLVDSIKEVVGFIIRFFGMSFLIREILCRNKVTIIFYHNPEPSIFKRHIDYLSKRYNFIPLNKLVNAIYSRDWSDIPPKGLVVTIDDGHRGNYKLLKIFKTYCICPTIYICSHIINTNRKFWWATGFRNFQKLKKYNNRSRLITLRNKLGYEQQNEYLTRQALNIKEIKEMLPYVDFQSHSRFHPILTTCTDKESKKEIKGSKNYLENLLNKEIKHYSYPNGDYADREIEYLKGCGYKSARTIDIGWNSINTNPYRLKAMGIEDNASINVLCGQINGFFGYLRYLRYGSFKKLCLSFI